MREAPQLVRAEHLHGALSEFLDESDPKHEAKDKPYAYATGQGGGEFGVWVCTFDDVTADRFVKRVAG
ncbi:MAG: hypothetical protein ACRCYU_04240, partial [Nocardioides sp.]